MGQSLVESNTWYNSYISAYPFECVSARYFKQALLVSECNGRISELRSKGYDIETSRGRTATPLPIIG